ncbi:MAG: ammonia channel protein, partial [Alphaproteobacteria bacterium]
ALDVVGVHCVGGVWGAIATGIFASKAVNSAGADGLLHGGPGLLLTQVAAVVATLVYCFVGAWVLLKVTDALVGLRAEEDDEYAGLDLSQHSERAYVLGSVAD